MKTTALPSPPASDHAVPTRKVLLISYHFPPDAAVGAIRPAKYAKYLSRLGWKPYILTVGEAYAPVRDQARLGDVAQLPITRTAVWPTVLDVALTLKRRLVPRTTGASSARPSSGQPDVTLLARLKRYANSVFELPDKQIGWLIPAVYRAYRLVKKEGIEVVVTSSPPRTTALVGLLLSYVARIRLVTDLRDPWFTPYLRDDWFRSLVADGRSPIGDRIERWLERKLVERSARVVTTTERHARALREAYPWLPEHRVRTVPNGYDAEDLAGIGIDRDEPATTFTASYLGTFYLHRTPKPLFEALKQLIDEDKLSPADVQVNLIGDVRSTTDASVDELIAGCGLAGCVRLGPPVSYRESLALMRESHLLLLFAPKQCCSVPGKTFEYLAARKPILCLADDGATADLIHSTRAGVVVPPDDVQAIKAELWRLFQAFKNGHPLMTATDISGYERKALSERFSRLLVEIA